MLHYDSVHLIADSVEDEVRNVGPMVMGLKKPKKGNIKYKECEDKGL